MLIPLLNRRRRRSKPIVTALAMTVVVACASTDPAPPPPAEALIELNAPTAPIVVEGHIVVGGGDGAVKAYRLEDGVVTEVARVGGAVDELAAAPGGVAAISGDGNTLTKISLDGGAVVLSDNRVGARDLVTDDTWAYFIDESNKLRRVPLAGGTTERLNGADDEKTHLTLLGNTLFYRAVEVDDATPVITIRSIRKTGGRPDDLDDLSSHQPTALFSSTSPSGLVLGTQKGAVWGDTDDDADVFEGVAPPLAGAWPIDDKRFVMASGHTLSVVNADRERRVIGKYSAIGGVAIVGRDVFYTDRDLGSLSVIRGAL